MPGSWVALWTFVFLEDFPIQCLLCPRGNLCKVDSAGQERSHFADGETEVQRRVWHPGRKQMHSQKGSRRVEWGAVCKGVGRVKGTQRGGGEPWGWWGWGNRRRLQTRWAWWRRGFQNLVRTRAYESTTRKKLQTSVEKCSHCQTHIGLSWEGDPGEEIPPPLSPPNLFYWSFLGKIQEEARGQRSTDSQSTDRAKEGRGRRKKFPARGAERPLGGTLRSLQPRLFLPIWWQLLMEASPRPSQRQTSEVWGKARFRLSDTQWVGRQDLDNFWNFRLASFSKPTSTVWWGFS